VGWEVVWWVDPSIKLLVVWFFHGLVGQSVICSVGCWCGRLVRRLVIYLVSWFVVQYVCRLFVWLCILLGRGLLGLIGLSLVQSVFWWVCWLVGFSDGRLVGGWGGFQPR